MDNTSQPPQHPVDRTDDGEVLASPTRRRPSRAAIAGGVGLFLAGAAVSATGLASAADSPSPSPSPSASPSSPSTPGSPEARERDGQRLGKGRGGPGWRGGIGLRGPMGALHGEFVAPRAEGGTQTFLVQRGEATAVSADSLTVKSSDGFTRTYAVSADAMVNANRDGLGSVKVGDEVHVLATLDGTTARALRVADITQRKAQRERFLPQPDRNAPAPGGEAPSRPAPGGTDPGSPSPESTTEGSSSTGGGTYVPA